MGRLGQLPIQIPSTVTVKVADGSIEVKGAGATLVRTLPREVKVEVGEGAVVVSIQKNSKNAKTMQGTTRAHIKNMVLGVTEGWKKQLEVNGPGYRAEARGQELVLTLGYAHPVVVKAPEGVKFGVEKNIITVEGANKEDVGHISALVRGARKPNPYTGAGVRYTDEQVRRKAGKQAGAKV